MVNPLGLAIVGGLLVGTILFSCLAVIGANLTETRYPNCAGAQLNATWSLCHRNVALARDLAAFGGLALVFGSPVWLVLTLSKPPEA